MSCSNRINAPHIVAEGGKNYPYRQDQSKGRHITLTFNALLSRGLMRANGSGSDIRFDTTEMMSDLKALAFFDEYPNRNGFQRGNSKQMHLSKWIKPVRVRLLFGPSLDQQTRQADLQTVSKYVRSPAEITSHPITIVDDEVIFMS